MKLDWYGGCLHTSGPTYFHEMFTMGIEFGIELGLELDIIGAVGVRAT